MWVPHFFGSSSEPGGCVGVEPGGDGCFDDCGGVGVDDGGGVGVDDGGGGGGVAGAGLFWGSCGVPVIVGLVINGNF